MDFISRLKEFFDAVLRGKKSVAVEAQIMADQSAEILNEFIKLFENAFFGARDGNQALNHSLETKKASSAENAEAAQVRYQRRETLNDVAQEMETINDEKYLKDKSDYPFVLVMDHTPQAVLNSMDGGKNRRILIRRDALYLAIRKEGIQEGHYHNLGAEILKKLPRYLESPDIILFTVDPKTGEESKIRRIALSHIDGANGQGIVSIEFESLKDFEGKFEYFNIVVTFFDLHLNYLKRLFKKNGAIIKAQKENLTQVNPQLYEWLRIINAKFSTTIIPDSIETVNTFSEKSSDQIHRQRRTDSHDDYSYQALASKPDMKLTRVGGTVPIKRADIVQLAKKNATAVGRTNETGSVAVYVDDIGVDVILGTDGLKHGLRRTKNEQTAQFDANYRVTLKAGEIIKNSIRINEMTPTKSNAQSSYILIGAAQGENELYIVRSVINRFSNELASMDVLYAINAKKESAALNAPRSADKPLSVTDSTISIAQLLDYVNKYFPDILPMSVLEYYGHTVRPEGMLGKSVHYQRRIQTPMPSVVLEEH